MYETAHPFDHQSLGCLLFTVLSVLTKCGKGRNVTGTAKGPNNSEALRKIHVCLALLPPHVPGTVGVEGGGTRGMGSMDFPMRQFYAQVCAPHLLLSSNVGSFRRVRGPRPFTPREVWAMGSRVCCTVGEGLGTHMTYAA